MVSWSSSASCSKRLPRATITANANSAATPPSIAAATSSEVAKSVPFNASLAAAEAVSLGDMGLINWLKLVEAVALRGSEELMVVNYN
jgi:hypothetical protein